MASSPNLMLIWILASALLIFGACAGAGDGDGAGGAAEVSNDQPPRFELDRFRSTISSLESRISDSVEELKRKQESIEKLERIILEKTDTITTLQQNIESLRGSVDAQKAASKGNKANAELEKQVEKLKVEIETQNKKRNALEIRAGESDRKVHEMSRKLENLQKTIGEQKQKIQKNEHAVKVAEERLIKVRLEMTSKSSRLDEVHEGWLPPWLEKHLSLVQKFMTSGWNENAKPAISAFIEETLEIFVKGKEWIQPYLKLSKTEWISAIKENIMIAKGSAGPHVEKMQELYDHYFQEIYKFSKPYLDKLHVAMKPYKRQILRVCRRFLKSATKHHMQVQTTIQEKLKQHEATVPLATKEFAWLTASALLTVPLFLLVRFLWVIFCKRTRRRRKNAHGNGNRRSRRRHSEKKEL